jgi:hypothetical protein
MKQARHMIMIGSSGRKAGKTAVARALIGAFKQTCRIAVLKVTCVAERGKCPHGNETCSACSDLTAGYELTGEHDALKHKDTSELLAAGADSVYWLRALYDSVEDGYADFCARVNPDWLILCESNSLRKIVTPGCFIMVNNTKHAALKPSAQDVFSLADITLTVDGGAQLDFDKIISRIHLNKSDSALSVEVV